MFYLERISAYFHSARSAYSPRVYEDTPEVRIKTSFWGNIFIDVKGFGFLLLDIPRLINKTVKFVNQGKKVTIKPEDHEDSLGENPRMIVKKKRNEVLIGLIDIGVMGCDEFLKELVISFIENGDNVVVYQFTECPCKDPYLAAHYEEYPEDRISDRCLENIVLESGGKDDDVDPASLITDPILNTIFTRTGVQAKVDERRFITNLFTRKVKISPVVVFEQ